MSLSHTGNHPETLQKGRNTPGTHNIDKLSPPTWVYSFGSVKVSLFKKIGKFYKWIPKLLYNVNDVSFNSTWNFAVKTLLTRPERRWLREQFAQFIQRKFVLFTVLLFSFASIRLLGLNWRIWWRIPWFDVLLNIVIENLKLCHAVNQIRFDVSMLSDICFRILAVRCFHYRGRPLVDFEIICFRKYKAKKPRTHLLQKGGRHMTITTD